MLEDPGFLDSCDISMHALIGRHATCTHSSSNTLAGTHTHTNERAPTHTHTHTYCRSSDTVHITRSVYILLLHFSIKNIAEYKYKKYI